MNRFRIPAYIALVFIFQEAVLRILFPVPEVKNFNRTLYMKKSQNSLIVNNLNDFTMKKVHNIRLSAMSVLDTSAEFVETLNLYGFRDKSWNLVKQPGTVRVFFVGDSFTEGVMAEDEETITEAFQKSANSKGLNTEAMNLGVAGGDFNSYAQLIYDAVPLFKPDYVIMVVYANDNFTFQPFNPLTPLKPEFANKAKPRLPEIISMIRKGEMIPFRFPIKKTYYMSSEQVKAEAVAFPYNETVLKEEVEPFVAEAIRKGQFDPYNIDAPFVKRDMFQKPFDAIHEFSFLKDHCDRNGSELMVVYLPSRSQVTNYYYQFQKKCCFSCPDTMDLTSDTYRKLAIGLSEDCEKLQVPFLDLSDIVMAEEKNGNHLYWNYDIHMKGRGYFLTGEEIFKWWNK